MSFKFRLMLLSSSMKLRVLAICIANTAVEQGGKTLLPLPRKNPDQFW